MITLTPAAIARVRVVLGGEPDPKPEGIRISILGGGCSGYSYQMKFKLPDEKLKGGLGDNVFEFDGVKVFVDGASLMYLEGTELDFIETLEQSGFKFNNPNVKSTCGCGSSFNV